MKYIYIGLITALFPLIGILIDSYNLKKKKKNNQRVNDRYISPKSK